MSHELAPRCCCFRPWTAGEDEDKYSALKVALRVGLITVAYVVPVTAWNILPAFMKVRDCQLEVVGGRTSAQHPVAAQRPVAQACPFDRHILARGWACPHAPACSSPTSLSSQPGSSAPAPPVTSCCLHWWLLSCWVQLCSSRMGWTQVHMTSE
jgi:hypothetical protein